MKAIPSKYKILLIIFGLCIAMLSGELLFRVWGLYVYKTKSSVSKEKRNKYRILCIGDSSTYGLGASDINEFSYPAQLQKILNEKIHGQKFEVINLGIPGINSSQVLNRFRKNVTEYNPDIVIAMVGINDSWNLEESNILKFYNDSNINILNSLRLRLGLLLNESQLYQFIKLVFISSEINKLIIPEHSDTARSKGFMISAQETVKSRALAYSIMHNITEMSQIAKSNHVNIIFMKYHSAGWGRPELIIHRTYLQLGVPIVDNARVFNKAQSHNLNVLGSDNWHPNDLGYLLIARNVYNTMVSSALIDGKPIALIE